MPQLISPDALTSNPFVVRSGHSTTLTAQGLGPTDYVIVEIVQLSAAPAPTSDPCCYQLASPTDVLGATALRCPNGARTILSQAVPFAVLNGPAGVYLRARVVPGDPSAEVTVNYETMPSTSGACCAECQEPFSASYPLATGGFGFVAGDMRDPAAVIEVQPCNGSGPVVYVFPSPRPGNTAPVRNCAGTVVGYGANTSKTAITVASTTPCAT